MIIEFMANEVAVRLGNVKSYKYDSDNKELHIKIDENESYFVANVAEVKEF